MIVIESRVDQIGFRRAHILVILFYNLLISSLFWRNNDELDRFMNATDNINIQKNVTLTLVHSASRIMLTPSSSSTTESDMW